MIKKLHTSAVVALVVVYVGGIVLVADFGLDGKLLMGLYLVAFSLYMVVYTIYAQSLGRIYIPRMSWVEYSANPYAFYVVKVYYYIIALIVGGSGFALFF